MKMLCSLYINAEQSMLVWGKHSPCWMCVCL